MTKVLAISGSTRKGSRNTGVLFAFASLAPKEVQVEVYDQLDLLPHFSPEKDGENSPQSVIEWRAKIQAADALIICTPEYAFGVPGVLKNSLDWIVSTGEINHKPTAAISASPLYGGGDKALASLLLTLGALDVVIIPETTLSIPAVNQKINPDGEILDEETRNTLDQVLKKLLTRVK